MVAWPIFDNTGFEFVCLLLLCVWLLSFCCKLIVQVFNAMWFRICSILCALVFVLDHISLSMNWNIFENRRV
jgi:hypothetical protein